MAPALQTKLLKVLEDKRVLFESSYYDEHDPNVPAYVKKLFADGAPADFILIGATTREPDAIDPAIRSRCAAVYFEPLTQAQIVRIVAEAAKRLGARTTKTRAGADRDLHQRGPQGGADPRRRVRPRALPARVRRRRSGALVRDEDVISVVQAGRIVRSAPPRARKKKEDRPRARPGRAALRRFDHRDRGGGVPGARTAQGHACASTTPPVRCRATRCSTRRRSCAR